MAHKIEFIKKDTVNGKDYKKSDTLSVSESIYKKLKKRGTIKDATGKRKK